MLIALPTLMLIAAAPPTFEGDWYDQHGGIVMTVHRDHQGKFELQFHERGGADQRLTATKVGGALVGLWPQHEQEPARPVTVWFDPWLTGAVVDGLSTSSDSKRHFFGRTHDLCPLLWLLASVVNLDPQTRATVTSISLWELGDRMPKGLAAVFDVNAEQRVTRWFEGVRANPEIWRRACGGGSAALDAFQKEFGRFKGAEVGEGLVSSADQGHIRELLWTKCNADHLGFATLEEFASPPPAPKRSANGATPPDQSWLLAANALVANSWLRSAGVPEDLASLTARFLAGLGVDPRHHPWGKDEKDYEGWLMHFSGLDPAVGKPRDPATVRILTAPPRKPFEALQAIRADDHSAPLSTKERAVWLRQRGAEIGCDALLVSGDRTWATCLAFLHPVVASGL